MKNHKEERLSFRSFCFRRLTLLFLLLVITFLVGLMMKNLANKLQEKNTSLFILNEREGRLEELKNQFQVREEDFVKIEKFLPKEKEMAGFVGFLDQLSSAEVSMSGFHFETEEPLQGPEEHPYLSFSLTLLGKFDDLKQFLAQLLSGPYLIKPYFGKIKSADNIFKSASLIIQAKLFVDPGFH